MGNPNVNLEKVRGIPDTHVREDETSFQDSAFVQRVCRSANKYSNQMFGWRKSGRSSTHPMMTICHSNMFSSSTSPALKPSTGFFCSSAISSDLGQR